MAENAHDKLAADHQIALAIVRRIIREKGLPGEDAPEKLREFAQSLGVELSALKKFLGPLYLEYHNEIFSDAPPRRHIKIN